MRGLGILVGLLAATASAQTCVVERLTVGANGADADGPSSQPVMTPDGRYVAYVSGATNLVPGDTNGVGDVFVRDLVLGTTERVSVGPGGVECDQACSYPALSDDGRYVAFNTASSTLDPLDTNNTIDVYLRDRTNGTTERVSVGAGGVQGDGPSFSATLTGDARYVLFVSWATNLVPGDTNATRDVFLRDRIAGVTELISVSTSGTLGNDLSGANSARSFLSPDARYVYFGSSASNLVNGDVNGEMDAFVRDRVAGTTTFLVTGTGGGQPNGFTDVYSMTRDGRYIGLVSSASDLVAGDTNAVPDAFLLDRFTGFVERVSITSTGAESTDSSWAPEVSQDGRYVLYSSAAADMAPNDPSERREIYRRDRFTSQTERFVPTAFVVTQQEIASAAISAAGDRAAFIYAGTEFDTLDQNGISDVFVSGCTTGRVFCAGDGTATPCPCGNAGAWNSGCANAATTGASLFATGSALTTNDTVALRVSGLPMPTTVRFMVGTSQLNGGAGFALGDGLRCVSGSLTYLATQLTQDGSATWGVGAPGAPLISVQSNVPLGGDTRWYQAWYRNPASFCTPFTHNLTNGLEIAWLP